MVSQEPALAKAPIGKGMDKAVFFSSNNSGMNTDDIP